MRCSVEFAKLPVVCSHGVCRKEAVRDGADNGGIVGMVTVEAVNATKVA